MRTWIVPLLLIAGLSLLAGLCLMGETKGKLESNELPMEVVDGYLVVVEGSIGNLHGLRFLLDTGATNSAIDRRLARTLGLSGRAGKLLNFDKTVSVEWCELPQVAYGPESATNVKMLVEDLRYFQASGLHVDAILGLDLLRRKSFRLDFVRKRVVFAALEIGTGKSVPMRADPLFLRVQAELDGRPVWMIADTGTRRTVFYEDRLGNISGNYKLEARAIGRSVGGAIDSKIAVVPRLRLNTQDLDRQVYLVRAPAAESLRGIAGYLGIAVLEAKEVAFDFERNQMTWTK